MVMWGYPSLVSSPDPPRHAPSDYDYPTGRGAVGLGTRLIPPGHFRSVTGILVPEKLVQGPKFLLEKMFPQSIFSGKIGPILKILVPP